jgi:predicted MFS family arabinose efflux permease
LFAGGIGGLVGNVLSVRLIRRIGVTNVAYMCNGVSALMLLVWPVFAPWIAAIYVIQFIWNLGGSGFPAVQQARLVSVAPMLAAATIALNSSMTYLGGSIGATIGAKAWTIVTPRYMAWVGFLFVVAALACSMLGERAATATPARTA